MFAKLNHCKAEAEAQYAHSQLIQEQTLKRKTDENFVP